VKARSQEVVLGFVESTGHALDLVPRNKAPGAPEKSHGQSKMGTEGGRGEKALDSEGKKKVEQEGRGPGGSSVPIEGGEGGRKNFE